MNLKYIFFDCMETLIDMNPMPSRDDYALWAYRGCGVEKLWPDYSEFLAQYNRARETLNRQHTDLREDSFSDRFILMCKNNPRISVQNLSPEKVAAQLSRYFLQAYYSRCFVHDDVKQMLPKLAAAYDLAIVSNFKTQGGIEYLLEAHGLASYFKFVLVSIDFGVRKPHPGIYKEAIQRSKVQPQDILFIGDDVQNDIVPPAELGMKTLLFDRYGKYDSDYSKIQTFYEFVDILGI